MVRQEKFHPRKGSAARFVVFGVVQGVGFRPFLFRLARNFGYTGWVKNIGFGVEIHVEGKEKTDFSGFQEALWKEKPLLAQIEDISVRPAAFRNYRDFRIRKSQPGESFVFISPDISTCDSCVEEITNPRERRYLYPFTNCTDCGPRYTIVKSLPYDRLKTTMADFSMCEDCRSEYNDPFDRRFHAQPIACPVCGPEVELKNTRTGKKLKGGVRKAVSLIKKGKILAVKGLGGFHLVCDSLNEKAVRRLRKIKERTTKPLALMAADIETIKKYAYVSKEEREWLLSSRRPIVLLRKKREIEGIAPHLDEIGFMLSYTPLHHLLLENLSLIVATSSNKKDAPIIKDEREGIKELCDYVLTHNRPIEMRADDSVLRVTDRKALFLRRARGFVPYPQRVPEELASSRHILALGGELKDTVSLYKNGYVITSQFLGDLDEYQNYRYFEETIRHLTRLFDVKPEVVISDLHPNFHTTRYAQKSGLPHLQVQHHFAHVLAAMLEHGIQVGKKVLGVSLDGYGYGQDGTAWGGEFLLAEYTSYERIAHFQPVPLPGGDLAARQPWRMAVSYLQDAFGSRFPKVKSLENLGKRKIEAVGKMIEAGINCPPTSSCGRLFDAVSFIIGLSPKEVEFEAEAPMRLEAAALEKFPGAYRFKMTGKSFPLQVSFASVIREAVADMKRKVPPAQISAKFHNTLAQVIQRIALKAKENQAVDTVILAGGCFLNKKLLLSATNLLEKKGFTVIRPSLYSPNDESISLGQIAYALARLKAKA